MQYALISYDLQLILARMGVGALVCWGAHGMHSFRYYPLKNKHLWKNSPL